MALNATGGPLWVNNPVDAPMIVPDADNQTFYKQPMYYVFGHFRQAILVHEIPNFSKFVKPDSFRINSTWNNQSSSLELISFITPTNLTVIVLHNRDEIENYSVSIMDAKNTCQTVNLNIEAKSIATVIWNTTTACGNSASTTTNPTGASNPTTIKHNHSSITRTTGRPTVMLILLMGYFCLTLLLVNQIIIVGE